MSNIKHTYIVMSIPMTFEAPNMKKDKAATAPLATMNGLTVRFRLRSHNKPQMGEAIELAPSFKPNIRPTKAGASSNCRNTCKTTNSFHCNQGAFVRITTSIPWAPS
jgi:hypothetical protein